MLELLRENATQHPGQIAVELLVNVAGDIQSSKDDERLAIVDQAHAAVWSALNEARDLLTRAGLDLGSISQARHANKTDVDTPAMILNQLKALLPGVDFSVPLDDEAEAYIAAQRRSKWIWLWVSLGVGVLIPVVVVALRVCG